MIERFGYDSGERLIFDRTKPCTECADDGDEGCGLFEEATPEDMLEYTHELESKLSALSKQIDEWEAVGGGSVLMRDVEIPAPKYDGADRCNDRAPWPTEIRCKLPPGHDGDHSDGGPAFWAK